MESRGRSYGDVLTLYELATPDAASGPSAASHGHAMRAQQSRRVPATGCAPVVTRVTALRVGITSAATLTMSAQGDGSEHQRSDFCLLLRSPRLVLLSLFFSTQLSRASGGSLHYHTMLAAVRLRCVWEGDAQAAVLLACTGLAAV